MHGFGVFKRSIISKNLGWPGREERLKDAGKTKFSRLFYSEYSYIMVDIFKFDISDLVYIIIFEKLQFQLFDLVIQNPIL